MDAPNTDPPVLGRFTGPAYPLGATAAAVFGPRSDLEVVLTSIINILGTAKGTYAPDLNLGTVAADMLFEPLDEITLGLIRWYTMKDLSEQEPRARFWYCHSERIDEHTVSITLGFSLVGDASGLVYNAPIRYRREAA